MNRQPSKLLDQVRDALRVKHYSIGTEEAYSRTIIYTHVLNRGGLAVQG